MSALLLAALFKFSWVAPTQPPSVTGYQLCVKRSQEACFVVAVVDDDTTTVQVELDPRETWHATVRAVNVYGQSDESNQVIIAAIPQPPSNVIDPAIVYHPNGQPFRDHWCAARETVCGFERDLFKCRKKTWKKCSQPFQQICKQQVSRPLP